MFESNKLLIILFIITSNKCKSSHIFNDFNSNQLKHLEKEFDSICGQKLSIDSNVKTSESIESEELNEKSGNK
jgi:hypothetical protein